MVAFLNVKQAMKLTQQQGLLQPKQRRSQVHDPGSRNCAMFVRYIVRNINSSELHFQSVALRSQYSDHTPEAVTLH